MKTKLLALALCLLLTPLCWGENTLEKRIAKAEWQVTQIDRKTDVIYEMVKALYIKHFGKKAYEKVLWEERKEDTPK